MQKIRGLDVYEMIAIVDPGVVKSERQLELGGTLSGEHGVGLLKMKYLPWEQSPVLLRLQRELKHVFDPLDLLNPGKLIPA